MGLRNGWRAKIWSVDRREKFSLAEMSVSNKDKDGTFQNEWSCKSVLLSGKAHDADVKAGDVVTIVDFEVKNHYDKEKKREYTNYIIHDLTIKGKEEPAKAETTTPATATEDEELPFS